MIAGRLRWLGLIAGSLLTLGGVSGCDVARLTLGAFDLERYDALETLTQEIPYGGQRVVIDSQIGKVVVRGRGEPGYVAWRPLLQITVVKKVRGLDLEDVRVSVVQDEEEIRVRAELEAPWVGRRLRLLPPGIEENVGWVELTLAVPPGVSLKVDQELGLLDVEGVQGELEAAVGTGEIVVRRSEFSSLALRSEVGDLSLRGISAGQLEARSEMGSLRVEGASFARATLSSELGDIAVEESRGDALQASTQMGGLEIRRSQLGSVRLESQMGSIALADTEPGGGWVSTQLGSIRLALPPTSPTLRVRAETQMGRIRLRGAEAVPTLDARWDLAWPGQALTLSFGEERELEERRTLRLSTRLGSIEIVLGP